MPILIEDLAYLETEIKNFRRDLHMYPELGFNETRTSLKIAEELKSSGVEVSTEVGITGVVGVLKKGHGTKNIMLRADMDALPINEKISHHYTSKNPGVMHACGHDGHTAMLLGAAKFLANNDCFSGTVYFVFQPNEEHGLGAKAMLEDGLLERFPAKEIYGIHNLPGAPLGEFSTRVGVICASETLFEITIEGRGGHSSMPHLGVDTIVVGSELVTSIQTIVSRKLDPGSTVVVSVTEFISDGARNVLPGKTVLKGDIRAHYSKDRIKVQKLLKQICNGVAKLHGVKIKISIKNEFIETNNSKAQIENAIKAANGLGCKIISDRPPMSFSEDFAQFASKIPGCFLLMGNGIEGANSQPLHSSDYDFNDEALMIGAGFWSRLVSNQLKS